MIVGAALRPVWVRPLVIGAALAVHAGALALFATPPPMRLLPPDTIEIAILQQAMPEPVPEPSSEPEPVFPASEVPPAPDVTPPDLPLSPVAEATPIVKPPEPKKPPLRRKPEPQRQTTKKQPVRTVSRPAAAASEVSASQYASMVVRAIQANRFYPASARNDGVTGSVSVHFTVGPSGRVRSAHVIRSSGSATLDGAALQIVRSIAPPPPPGGVFTGSTSLRFNLSR